MPILSFQIFPVAFDHLNFTDKILHFNCCEQNFNRIGNIFPGNTAYAHQRIPNGADILNFKFGNNVLKLNEYFIQAVDQLFRIFIRWKCFQIPSASAYNTVAVR